ncbi:MAG: Type 1 glutamine amidotransferase-like domain-containing protein [Candidatus Dormibacteraeota bacterium]|nr:Type 1 glutamine amidotransferase-like domain-containing protein [Candidatus Dormibacteraeota bacterium]
MSRGPIALVGSGEFTPAMEDVDRLLLTGRNQRVVFLPTAAAREGNARIRYWVDLGLAHYQRLGAEAVPLMVLGRDDAENVDLAAQVEGAGLVYLSGGDPTFLADTLRGTAVAAALRLAWEAGMAVGGCSAGAMALADHVPRVRDPTGPPVDGLGFVADLVVIPHFDRIDHWLPGASELAVASAPEGAWVLGIDEETAAVGGPRDWSVHGRGSAWLMKAGVDRQEFGAGTSFVTPAS